MTPSAGLPRACAWPLWPAGPAPRPPLFCGAPVRWKNAATGAPVPCSYCDPSAGPSTRLCRAEPLASSAHAALAFSPIADQPVSIRRTGLDKLPSAVLSA